MYICTSDTLCTSISICTSLLEIPDSPNASANVPEDMDIPVESLNDSTASNEDEEMPIDGELLSFS